MLVGLDDVLALAQAGQFAVPAFNVYNMETVMGAVQAAEAKRAPVILQIYARLFSEENARFLAPIILAAADSAAVPVCFHLDHGANDAAVLRALRCGATGVMRDGSLLPYAQNAALTKQAVSLCGHADVRVEGELGHIGSANDDSMDALTEPDAAAAFAKETGVCCLAVLVGNAHGHYQKPPKLDIARICAIREAAGGLPLVLHGGSGIPDEQLRQAIRAGIRKINFSTDVCCTFLQAVQEALCAPRRAAAIDLFMREPVRAVAAFCEQKIELLGAAQRV